MLETLDLGSFSLKTRHNDVNVSTAVSASATLSHDGSTNLYHLLNSNFTNNQTADNFAWVRQSRVLVLKLHISIDGSGLHREEEQQIMETVMDAKLWSQLHLQCSCPSADSHVWNTQETISFELRQDYRATELQEKALHGLAIADSTTNIQSPDGVSVAHLEEVNIRIEITSRSCCTAVKRTKSAVIEKQETQYVSPVRPSGEISNDDDLFALSQEDVTVHQAFFSYGLQTLLMMDESKHDFDSMDTKCSRLSRETRRHSETPLGYPTGTAVPLDHNILKEVVDLAIRRTIAERPLEIPKRTKVRSANVTPLSHLAPAIWSSSHQTRIAQRACFLPTIAHALSASTPRTFRSPSLRSKIDLMKRRQLDENPAPHSATSTAVARLWCLLQRGLHDRNASNALCSMVVTFEAEQTLQEPEQLLHEGQRRETTSAKHIVGLELHDFSDYDEDLDQFDYDGNAYDDDDVNQLLQEACAEGIDFNSKPCPGNWDNDLLSALEDEGADDEAQTTVNLDGPANLKSELLLPFTAEQLQIGDIARHYDQFEALMEAAVSPSISIDAMSEPEGYLAPST